jgi:hypothetical protein
MPGNNIWGLTNRQLMARTLRRLVDEAEINDGCISRPLLEHAKAVLSEVVRNKRPTTEVKESKRI